MTAGHEMLSFMDAYSGYNQILMKEADETYTAFRIDQENYCYRVMPSRLKNAGATYQRMVNKMFEAQIGHNMEVYVDDMLIKSVKAKDHLADLKEVSEVLHKPDISGRLITWAVELRKYDIKFQPRTAIKGQALADFIVECTFSETEPEEVELEEHDRRSWEMFINRSSNAAGSEADRGSWEMIMDGLSNAAGSGTGFMITNPEGLWIQCALWFTFQASNNEAKYEALLAGLKVARTIQVTHLAVRSDSQLVVNQVMGSTRKRMNVGCPV
ncbi:uncharacterized protein LOC122638803 [Telopea speciosissima]|uniref:uncharacterized protein LOC122638803 n=1 Tax=Telopea speciosissima TaxID=54955 RepID=UPI001CC79D8A|nr:uncharacterized protein LOC122638803 [Telopea speciosissima]